MAGVVAKAQIRLSHVAPKNDGARQRLAALRFPHLHHRFNALGGRRIATGPYNQRQPLAGPQ
jgi:hypothetical protein